MADRPPAEITIDERLVAALLRSQHPELCELELSMLARGWDNTIFRLGADHIVRLPHRQIADQLIVNEQRWLGVLAEGIDLGVPAPTHLGVPSAGYPWHWSVLPWFEGAEAARGELVDPVATAAVLGRFFAQLHQPAPIDAPVNTFRGCPLGDRAGSFHANLTRLTDRASDREHDRAAIGAVFDEAAAVEPSQQRLWLHGDLHTRNLIVRNGELVAAIDWGDICGGDPATDLAAAYMLVPDQLVTVKDHAGATEDDWQRARGWAIHFGVVYLVNSDDDPVMGGIGERLLRTVLS